MNMELYEEDHKHFWAKRNVRLLTQYQGPSELFKQNLKIKYILNE